MLAMYLFLHETQEEKGQAFEIAKSVRKSE